MERPLRFGIFMAPFHPAGQNPTLALERDLELIERLDELGYDEAWIGEHHSAGLEIIASPEVMIASAAQRTEHIRLGTGVSSLPYHHPLMLADRIVQLDHITRGRVMFGVGPGALPSDARMMGIDPATQRERMEEALGAIMLLLNSEEPVSMKTDWFTLDEARLQLRPYTYPHFEIAVAATVSPAGPRTAGHYGVGLLSLGATSQGGFGVLADHWKIWNDNATQHGHSVDRAGWRLVGPMHVAPSRQQALEEVEYGIHEWIDYFKNVVALPLAPEEPDPGKWVQALIDSGTAVIGTPDDAAAQIERLKKQSGGFGCYLIMANDWVERTASLASYELLAKEVFPRFQGSGDWSVRSREWCRADHDSLIGGAMNAVAQEIDKYEQKTGYRVSVAGPAQGNAKVSEQELMPVAGPAGDSVKISEQEPIPAATGAAEDQGNAKMSEEEKQNLLADLTKANDMIAQSDMPFAARMILKVSCNALTAAVKSGNEPAAEHINRVRKFLLKVGESDLVKSLS